MSLIHSLLNRDYHLNFKQLDVTCTSNFYNENVKLIHSESVTLFMKTLGQSNDTWKKARMCRITGSICYEICTYTRNKSPDWNKKVETIFYSKFEGNANTRYGTLNENKAIAEYERVLHVKSERTGFFVNPLCPWLGYSADGVVWSTNTLLEVKCPIEGKTKTAADVIKNVAFMNVSGNDVTFKKKHKYYAQAQLGMMLLGFPKCHFIVYASHNNSVYVIELTYDKAFCNLMVNYLKQAYFNNILPIIERKSIKT